MTVKIAFSKNYLKDVKSLSDDDQYFLGELLNRIRHNRVTASDHREAVKCKSGQNVFSYRVNHDVRLAAYLWKPNEYLMIACDHHEALYDRVNRMRLETAGVAALPAAVEPEIKSAEPSQSALPPEMSFANGLSLLSAAELVTLGLDETKAMSLRSAATEDDLISVVQEIEPEALRDGLIDIACGNRTLGEVQEALKTASDQVRRSVDTILNKNLADRENYFVLNDYNVERYFNGTLENWQVFLHPDQTRGVEMVVRGPMMVTGAAGTGKSVVAVHRVKWLLTHPLKVRGRVLLTTFTHTLAEYSKKLLSTICTDEEMRRVDVVHFDKYLHDLKALKLPSVRICYDKVDFGIQTPYVRQLKDAYALYQGSKGIDFVANEYDRVIAEYDITSLDAYQSAVRPKDLGQLNAQARALLWPVFAELNKRRRVMKLCPRAVVINMLTDIVTPRDCRYESIVVDEAQDMGAPEYRLLAKLTGNTFDSPVAYSLFFAGDGHQRIYNRAGSLKQCGINVTGRSVRLVKCYRSTKKIREYAEKIIAGIQVKDMDEEIDSLIGCESLAEGVPPEVRFANSANNKYETMAQLIRSWIANNGKLGECAVLVRRNGQLDNVVQGLSLLGLNAVRIDRETVNFDADSVKVMTMHRAKGLQFVNVVVDVDGWPQKGVGKVVDGEASDELLAQEKCLLYMSVMRAMNNVLITSSHGVNMHVPSDQILL